MWTVRIADADLFDSKCTGFSIITTINIDYVIESATYGFLFTSCKTLENERAQRTSEFSKVLQRVNKILTKHFLCCNLFIVYRARI